MHVHGQRTSFGMVTNSLYIASVYEMGKPSSTFAIASYEQLLPSRE